MTFPLLFPFALKKAREVRKEREEAFRYIIEKNFKPELGKIKELNRADPEDRDEGEKKLFEYFKDKYLGECPSELYHLVGEDLQERYDSLCSEAMENLK